MKIALACDHAGFALKRTIGEYLKESGYEVADFGTDSNVSCDYPDYACKAAEAVARGDCERGILVCYTGVGVSIAANKVKGIRCALCGDATSARLTRAHNDANMLALGAGIVGGALALDIVKTFLETPFSGEEKHCRRVAKITAIEERGGPKGAKQ